MNDPLDLGAPAPDAPPAKVLTALTCDTRVLLLGPITGHWVHWVKKRTLPCQDPGCPLCKRRVPARWQGYGPALLLTGKLNASAAVYKTAPIVLPCNPEQEKELTAAGAPPLELLLRPRRDKRGFDLAKITQVLKNKSTPPAFDVRPVLYRLFGVRPPAPAVGADRCDSQ